MIDRALIVRLESATNELHSVVKAILSPTPPVADFIKQRCFHVPGAMTTFKEFFAAFDQWAAPKKWTREQVIAALPQRHP